MSRMSQIFTAQQFAQELAKDFLLCDLAERAFRESEYQEVYPILKEYHGQAPSTLAVRVALEEAEAEAEAEGDRFDPDISTWEDFYIEAVMNEAKNFEELYGVSIMGRLC
jgi:hypothetical protein